MELQKRYTKVLGGVVGPTTHIKQTYTSGCRALVFDYSHTKSLVAGWELGEVGFPCMKGDTS